MESAKKKCILLDVDGTLTDPTHRRHFLKQSPPDWESFLSACGEDDPNEDIVALAHLLMDAQEHYERESRKSGICSAVFAGHGIKKVGRRNKHNESLQFI